MDVKDSSRIRDSKGIEYPEAPSDAAFFELNTYNEAIARNRKIAWKGFISHKAGCSHTY